MTNHFNSVNSNPILSDHKNFFDFLKIYNDIDKAQKYSKNSCIVNSTSDLQRSECIDQVEHDKHNFLIYLQQTKTYPTKQKKKQLVKPIKKINKKQDNYNFIDSNDVLPKLNKSFKPRSSVDRRSSVDQSSSGVQSSSVNQKLSNNLICVIVGMLTIVCILLFILFKQ